MKEELLKVINEYLSVYDESEKLKPLIEFTNKYTYEEIIDWNNFDGHIVSSGFVYDKSNNKFLVIYHKDHKMYVYPGGHVDKEDTSILSAAKREIVEETGITNFEIYGISNNNLVPFDIDIHIISHNDRLNLPQHTHFDFRYLFIVDNIDNIKIDEEESSSYKWLTIDELKKENSFNDAVNKLEKIIYML